MNNKVAIERCAAYDSELVYNALKKAVELAGVPDVAGKTVLLKPNILSDSAPEKAITTHPVFLEAAIRLVREWGAARILVGDSPGVQGLGFTGKVSGLGETTEKNNAEWVDFTSGKTDILCPEGKVIKKFTVTKAVKDADVIISLPKLKTHQLMYFTGAMKNLFGLIPSVAKSPYHARFPGREKFAAMLVDLNLAVKPAYAMMDGIVGMEGPGPGSGDPRQVGIVMASSNLLAMDIAACAVIGYPAVLLPTNREALSRKIWLSEFKDIEYPGLTPEDVRVADFVKIPFKKSDSQLLDFLLPKPLSRLRDSSEPRPAIKAETCISCGDCQKICACDAISLSAEGNKPAVINYQRCIRCFCCHEVCPVKAIDIAKK